MLLQLLYCMLIVGIASARLAQCTCGFLAKRPLTVQKRNPTFNSPNLHANTDVGSRYSGAAGLSAMPSGTLFQLRPFVKLYR